MRILVIALVLCLLSTVQRLGAQTGSGDEQAVHALIQSVGAALNARDYAAAANLFADDGDLIFPRGPHTTGPDDIRAVWQQRWSAVSPDRRMTLTTTPARFLTPDVAVVDVRGEYSVGEPARDRATYVVVRRNGEWRVAVLRVMIAEAM